MKCKILHLLILAAMLTGSAACSHHDNTAPTPRPRAYHRIEVPQGGYDTTMLSSGHRLVTNAATRVMEKRQDGPATWVDVVYPHFRGATLYCSFTPVTDATRASVVDNRLERMALNSGGNESDLLEFTTPSGYDCRILITGAGTATPVQFIGVSEKDVVSGTFMVNVNEGFRPDSLAPVVESVSRDVTTLLKSL